MPEPLLVATDIAKLFPSVRGAAPIRAVDGVDLHIDAGETLALVGESGCGKTTLGRIIAMLETPSRGRVTFDGLDVHRAHGRDRRLLRRRLQIVLQDPYDSLHPMMTAEEAIGEAWRVHPDVVARSARSRRSLELLDLVGLASAVRTRFPDELSGGQRQRVAIARALAVSPDLIVCDEPVSALDVSIRAQIVNLLQDLQVQLGLSYLVIAHDLALVRHLARRVAVMYLGQVVETGPSWEVFERPHHPYTKALLSAIPAVDTAGRLRRPRIILEGELPHPSAPPTGCRFRTRCWKATELCAEATPEFTGIAGHSFACHHPESQ